MEFKSIAPNKSISSFVKNILIFEDKQPIGQKTVLPFFADGYPGLMFQQTETGLWVNPQQKDMPALFLYGQTVAPIELVMHGSYKLIGFQLYPFVIKSFFNVNPKVLNDGCYDLSNAAASTGEAIAPKLSEEPSTEQRIAIISKFLEDVFHQKKAKLDLNVKQAIQLIDEHKGQLSIKEVCARLHITERTLERNFLDESGITPKQFSKMIQFQQSLERLNGKDYSRLTDVVYANGFADQSHFIRIFKSFTGKTPKQYTGNTA